MTILKKDDLCRFYRCKNKARGLHCRSCDVRVCRDHQEPSGFGNHGMLTGKINIERHNKWRRIKK